MNKKVAIIGAGPAGLTSAYILAKNGVEVDLYESGEAVGGMAKTISLWGQLVDLGPHRFFSSDPRVNNLWLEIIGNDYSMVNRLTRIYYKNTFFDYPLKAFNALFGLGIIQSIFCVLSYVRVKIAPLKDESTFDTWVINRFGQRLYQIFFKSYSEKLWGIPCHDLDADFAAQRIKKLSLFEAIKATILCDSSKRKHKTLVDEFAYPNYGAGAVYEKMAERIASLGGRIHLQSKVSSACPARGGTRASIKFHDGSSLEYDHVISSMPITQLVDRIGAPEEIKNHAKSLSFRNTILVYLQLNCSSPFPDQWVYVHSSELMTGRISNFKNWVPEISNGHSETILCLEYWCYDSDEIWSGNDDDLIDLATKEIYLTGLIPVNSILQGKVVRVPKCYPVYARGYQSHLKPIERYFSNLEGISVIGRYGSFKYNNQDHSILMGLLAAENIINNASHNLWDINTDYEYQESCRITATGLAWNS